MNTQPFSQTGLSLFENGWVFVNELNGCGFKSSCSHINDMLQPEESVSAPLEKIPRNTVSKDKVG